MMQDPPVDNTDFYSALMECNHCGEEFLEEEVEIDGRCPKCGSVNIEYYDWGIQP